MHFLPSDGGEPSKPMEGDLQDYDTFSSFSSYRTIQSSVVTSNSISDSIDEEADIVDVIEGGRVGLYNLGNTCFLNSTLQCLSAADELSISVAQMLKDGEIRGDKFFSFELAKLFSRMWRKPESSFGSNAVDPRSFKYALGQVDHRFDGFRQEDSQEALAIILDRLHEDLKKPQDIPDTIEEGDKDGWIRYCLKEDSIVRKLFHGQLRSILTCARCGHASETFDPFCFLNLPIPQLPAPEPIAPVVPSKPKQFQVAFYNDSVTSIRSANLRVYKTFSTLQEFSSHFAGVMGCVVQLDADGRPKDFQMRLGSIDQAYLSHTVMAYRLDGFMDHFLVTLQIPGCKCVGFPIKVSLPFQSKFTLEVFVGSFFAGTLLKIVHFKFPEKIDIYEQMVTPIVRNPADYFKILEIESKNPLVSEVKIEVIDQELNNSLFGGDLVEFFDNLSECKELDDDEDDYNGYGYSFRNYTRVSSQSYHSTSHYTSSYKATPRHPLQVSLTECFEAFLAQEPLTAECEKCKAVGEANKKLDLWRLPPLLILHLKRFSYGGWGSKIDTIVNFPVDEVLTLNPLSGAGPAQYDLFAVSQHYGSLYYGHYTAMTWHRGQKCWALADDGTFAPTSSSGDWGDRSKSAGYVLFYRLRQ